MYTLNIHTLYIVCKKKEKEPAVIGCHIECRRSGRSGRRRGDRPPQPPGRWSRSAVDREPSSWCGRPPAAGPADSCCSPATSSRPPSFSTAAPPALHPQPQKKGTNDGNNNKNTTNPNTEKVEHIRKKSCTSNSALRKAKG